MLKLNIGIVSIVGFVALRVIAAPSASCDTPREKWMKEPELRSVLRRQGYLIGSIGIVNGCYEFYGLDPRGRRIQILIDPETAKPVVSKDNTNALTGS